MKDDKLDEFMDKEKITKPVINNGLDISREREEQIGTEYQFGAHSIPSIAIIPVEQREMYLPKGELQFGVEDFMDCASRAPINSLEAQFTWLTKNKKIGATNLKWMQDNGYITPEGRVEFSDRFIAILSNTTRSGNSLKGPLQAITNSGLIPKSILKKEVTFTFDQYHDKTKITQKMRDLGKEFLARFPIEYDQVFPEFANVSLTQEPQVDAAYAWPVAISGVYPRSDKQFNHAFLRYGLPEWQAFDNYEESPGDFTKTLAPDYRFFDYGYRIYIVKENVLSVVVPKAAKSFWSSFINYLKQIFV